LKMANLLKQLGDKLDSATIHGRDKRDLSGTRGNERRSQVPEKWPQTGVQFDNNGQIAAEAGRTGRVKQRCATRASFRVRMALRRRFAPVRNTTNESQRGGALASREDDGPSIARSFAIGAYELLYQGGGYEYAVAGFEAIELARRSFGTAVVRVSSNGCASTDAADAIEPKTPGPPTPTPPKRTEVPPHGMRMTKSQVPMVVSRSECAGNTHGHVCLGHSLDLGIGN